MQRVGQYKKAEKNAIEIVNDYEQMKVKYFNVLTELSGQKTQIQELIQAKLDAEIQTREHAEENQRYINELYQLRIDITKRIDEVSKKTAQITHLQEELQNAHKKVNELMRKDNEIASL
jgi:DNA repair exonuclease SbcCD ATPase subunit